MVISVATRKTRPINWNGGAKKDFKKFPKDAQTDFLSALTIAAEGTKADKAKPMQGMGSAVLEIALPFKGDAYRVVYEVRSAEIFVVHAFKKKSTKGIKTPKKEIELIKKRLK